MADIKVAIIGCGGRGREHAAGYAASADVEIVGVADPVLEAAQKLAGQHKVKAVYEDYRVMLQEQKPDMVSVCTWTGQHYEQIVDSVEAGARAINAEKPMAPTWGESRRMHQACVDAGVQMTFCHQRRFGAQFTCAHQLARAGAVGKVHRLEGFCPNLFDWGTHWFDMFFYYNDETPAEWVMGQIDLAEVKTVFAVPVESSGLSWIKFSNDVRALLVTGKQTGGACSNRIIGSEGMIEVLSSDGGTVRLLNGEQPGWQTVSLEGVVPPGSETTLAMLDSIECLKSGAEPLLSSRKALQATELIFATYQSARTHSKVTLPLDIEESPLLEMLEEQGYTAAAR